MSEHVTTVFQKRLLEKCNNPNMFTLPCVIGEIKFDKAMLDLGASSNVLPSPVYEALCLGL